MLSPVRMHSTASRQKVAFQGEGLPVFLLADRPVRKLCTCPLMDGTLWHLLKPVPSLQCYLKDAAARIERDMQRAAEERWKFGAKTVRGAYMVVERARAVERGCESPIWDSLQETHDNYNRCIFQFNTAGIRIASCCEP